MAKPRCRPSLTPCRSPRRRASGPRDDGQSPLVGHPPRRECRLSDQIHTSTADEAGCGPRQGTDRLAPDRHHRRPRPQPALPSRSTRTRLRPDQATRRALSATHQSHRRRPRDPLGNTTSSLSPSKKQRRKPQRGPRHPTDLPSRGTSGSGPISSSSHFLAYCSYISDCSAALHALAPEAERAQRHRGSCAPSR